MYATEPMPLGYLSARDGISIREDDDAVQEMLDKWEQARRSRVWAYVGQALEAKTLQFSADQIQLADQRQHAVLEIARAAGIDPEDLGVSTTSRTYQNSEQRRRDLLDFTLTAYMSAVEQRLSMRDVLPRGYEAKVNLDAFLRADTKGRMESYAIGFPVGAYTEEEIRELEGRPSLTPAERTAKQPVAIPKGVMDEQTPQR
jgi:HK97 family phage portal protein